MKRSHSKLKLFALKNIKNYGILQCSSKKNFEKIQAPNIKYASHSICNITRHKSSVNFYLNKAEKRICNLQNMPPIQARNCTNASNDAITHKCTHTLIYWSTVFPHVAQTMLLLSHWKCVYTKYLRFFTHHQPRCCQYVPFCLVIIFCCCCIFILALQKCISFIYLKSHKIFNFISRKFSSANWNFRRALQISGHSATLPLASGVPFIASFIF